MSKDTLVQAYRTIQELERRLKESRRASQDPIAIVGMACRFPGARNPQEFFELLRDGRDCVAEVPRDRWDIDLHYDPEAGVPRKMYTRFGCFLNRVDEFDAEFFQVAPREARMMDPQQRLLLEVAWEALEDASLAQLRESSIGVFVGVMHLEYGALAARRDDAGYFDVHSGTGCEMSVLAGRLSHFLNLRGPSLVVGTACSSSLVAVHLACQSLRSRECRAALAGGVSLMLSPDMTSILCRMRALAKDGRTKAFDDSADGYGRGEGCGVVVLKRLEDALKDGDRVWAVLRGSAINHDGPSGGLTVPSAAAQETVVRRALESAEFRPEDIDYLEAHGTGTSLGDPIELAALAKVFSSRQASRPLLIGSVKANVGHLEAAAGMAGLLKVVLALKHGWIPRQVHFDTPNRHIPWNDIPIQVVRQNTSWPARSSPRRAGVSAFGLSGINAHVLVEEGPASHAAATTPALRSDRPRHVLTLSGRSPASLNTLARNLEQHVMTHPEESIADICFSMNTGRAVFGYRWAASVSTRDELLAQLRNFVARASPAVKTAPLCGFVFSSELLSSDEHSWVSSDPECEASSGVIDPLAVARMWRAWGVVPSVVVGIGEAGAAAACSFADAKIECVYGNDVAAARTLLAERGIKAILEIGTSLGKPFPENIGNLFTEGADIDWARFDRPFVRRRLSLPTYPFQRESHWLDAARTSMASPSTVERVHPLLGTQLQSPALREIVFETSLSIGYPAYLADHRVHGQALMPAAAMLEWASLVLARSGWNSFVLDDFVISVPLVLSERPVSTQLILDTEKRSLVIASHTGTATAASWSVHATARISPASVTDDNWSAFLKAQTHCATVIPVAGRRDRLRRLGLEYGPAFCGLRELRRSESEALALIELPVALAGEAGDYRVHPALLDACLQTACAWLEEDDVLLIPTSIGRFQWQAEATPLRVWSHARRAGSRTADDMILDFRIYSDAGELLGELTKVQLRSTSLDWFYEVAWEPAPLYTRTALAFDPARANLFWKELNDLCQDYIAPVIAQFERMPDLASLRHRELLSRLKKVLPRPNGSNHDTAGRARHLLASYPDYRPELELVMRAGAELFEVLQDRKDPLEILFGNNAAKTVYRESIAAQALNALVARETADVLAASESTLHILEIGGGTGGTTHALLPRLADQDVSYTFTDIAPQLVARAAREFGSYPFVTARSLDIERSPSEQGLEDGAYDLIVAANVVHATRSLQDTLRHIRQLLKPGGQLILVEGTEPQQWLDMTFGLTEGWWRFADRDLRPRYPLLQVDRWRSILSELNFETVNVLPEPEIRAALAGQVVITAMKGGAISKQRPRWLVLADQGHASSDFLARIESWGHDCVVLASDDSAIQKLDALIAENVSWRGIVHLWSLDIPSGAALAADLERSCGSILALVHALLRTGRSRHRVWCITSGAQWLEQDTMSVSQSPLWGIARTLRQEHPEIVCTCLDLDPADASATEWLDEFMVDDGEREIVYRAGQRYASRLRRSRQLASSTLSNSKLVIDQRGSLDNLRLVAVEQRAPGPREVTIEVEAAGLNFLDVLDALGILPFARSWVGGECAGRIVLAGGEVGEFAIGDEVLALAPGSFATTVTVSADLVARKPRRLSFQQAAGLPVAMLTAVRCFELAGVTAGTRILVHAAAGGVGLSAVRLAQRAGAEVFATAGSEEKRSKLRHLGVQHLYSSRSLDFLEGIREATQGRGVDVVLNCLKGEFIPASLATLAPGGRFVEIGKTEIWTHEQVARSRPDVSYSIYDLAQEVSDRPAAVGRRLRELCDEVDARPDLEPLPHRPFAFAQASNAFRWMAQSRHFGKIVLVPREPATSRSWRVRADATYLITGAFGGLGLWMCDWLAQKGAKHMMLWGKREPTPQARAAIAALTARGVEIVTRKVDVAAADQVRAALEAPELQTYSLRGVLHCAGILDDGLLRDLTWPRFLNVLGPKAIGAWNLHQFLEDRELDWFVLFSSAASLLGSAGQANHSAANAFLDALAHLRRADGLSALSINWGAWDQIGAAARKGNQQALNRRGVRFISPDDARRALVEVQRYDGCQLGVFPMDWDAYSTNYPPNRTPRFVQEMIRGSASTISDEAPARWTDKLRETPVKGRRTLLSSLVQEEVQQILGRRQPLDPHQPLRETGLDSLLALELCNHLGAHLGMKLSPTLLFDYPTIAALTDHLRQAINLQPASVVDVSITDEAASIDELTALLTAELATSKKRSNA